MQTRSHADWLAEADRFARENYGMADAAEVAHFPYRLERDRQRGMTPEESVNYWADHFGLEI